MGVYSRASLVKVVVNGAPPVDMRICSRVSLKSRPTVLKVAAAATAGFGTLTGVVAPGSARPSRKAFSNAVFSARAFLSASI